MGAEPADTCIAFSCFPTASTVLLILSFTGESADVDCTVKGKATSYKKSEKYLYLSTQQHVPVTQDRKATTTSGLRITGYIINED